MANPFEGMDDDQKEYQKAVAENVNKRMENAMNDLKQKYAKGEGGKDGSDNGPTGDAYKQHEASMKKKAAGIKNAQQQARAQEAAMLKAQKENLARENAGKDSDDSGDEYDDLLDDLDADPEMEALRSARINAMRQQSMNR
jgi:hypothetical protein